MKKILSLISLIMLCIMGMNAQTTIYSWESPEGTPAETGGTIAYVNGDGDRLNYQNSGNYTICLNGKKANLDEETASANAGKMVITLDQELQTGDEIAITAYITKNSAGVKSSAYIVFETGTTAESAIFSDEANIYEGFNGSPKTVTVTVPEEAAGSKTITMTRGQTGTNLFITKLVITGERTTTKTIGLVPGVWAADNATFAAYAWDSEGNAWFPFVEANETYSAQIPDTYTGLILVRLKPSTADGFNAENYGLNWDNKWNQTDDIDFTAIADQTIFTITDWSTYTTLPEVEEEDPGLVAPKGWTLAITNGNLEGEGVSSFVMKEYPSDDVVAARIGAGKDDSRGILVKSADETENGSAEAWDSQFWIKLNEALPAGTIVHVEFDYKASQAAKVSTQSHGMPGNYAHWTALGDINFTTEWNSFSKDFEVTSDMASKDGGLLSIAFNLAEEKTATEYYFDNFGVWYKEPKEVTDWADIIVNGDMEGDDAQCFYVTEQGVGGPFLAEFTEGIGKDGSKAIKVQSADNPANAWDTQFFVRLPYQLPTGTKYRISFDYKADKAGDFETQSHAEPGQYIHWAAVGTGSFTTEWQSYSSFGTIPAECDGSQGDGFLKIFQSVAFDLALNGEATEFIFDNVKFEVDANILDELINNPDIDPIPYTLFVGFQDAINKVKAYDVAELADVIANAQAALDDKDATLESLQTAIATFEAGVNAYLEAHTSYTIAGTKDLTGTENDWEIVNANNMTKNTETGLYEWTAENITVNADNQPQFKVVITNFEGNQTWLPLGDGSTNWVITPDVVGGEGVYSITITFNAETKEIRVTGEKGVPVGINTVNAISKNAIIYNLNGQRVEKAQKGLYLINGKKVSVK